MERNRIFGYNLLCYHYILPIPIMLLLFTTTICFTPYGRVYIRLRRRSTTVMYTDIILYRCLYSSRPQEYARNNSY